MIDKFRLAWMAKIIRYIFLSINRILFCAVFSIFLSACTFDDSDDVRDGYAYYKIGENKAALALLEPNAHKDSRAALIVGKIYEGMNDGEKNTLKAKEYYDLAANLGNKHAEYRLALLRIKSGDDPEFLMLEKLGEEKNVEASILLFELSYERGDLSKAIKYLDDVRNKSSFADFLYRIYTNDNLKELKNNREMAKSGDIDSTLVFADALMQKASEPIFPDKARYWYSLVAEESEEAKYKLAELYALGVGGQIQCDRAVSLLDDVADKDNEEFIKVKRTVLNICLGGD